ncbi:MAG TPA: dihydrolipoamide acetyltransferase family protein [Segeticoccus sp.]|uniref:dihydrolipoamide acetyltransferase family protein n=1 Tax=Segeticoccus sp. TaxID=2706531 RepID=UPI002D7FFCB3|nr:dihydrolipoamide acetyltransferase family protein [Segeticoccus sp.]HET8602033.1 dihydrolipoamide acetyltransferase family protein [Segeticoccus sp.]
MGVKNFRLPDPGEGLVEAEIVSWKVKKGDTVKTNDVVVEVETAKSLVELPVPWDGSVVDLLVPEGTTVEVGQPILAVDVAGAEDEAPAGPAGGAAAGAGAAAGGAAAAEEGERVANLVGYGPSSGSTRRRRRKGGAPGRAAEGAQAAMGQVGGPAAGHAPAEAVAASDSPVAAAPQAPAPTSQTPAPPAAQAPAAEATPPAPASGNGGRPLAKPPVRKFAKDNGIDLALVTPTREDGIISRADVEQFLVGGGATAGATGAAAAAASATQAPAYPVVAGERETRIPIKGVRKMTAQAMVGSAFTAPHVTEFVTVDVTRTMKLVERLREDREFAGVKVSPLLVVAKALILAVRRNPGVNATWDEAAGEIIQKNYVNLGIAAATPRGLIVPNIKDADRMSLRQLADALADLTQTAREGRTTPAAQAGGTITITNVGVFGVDNGTPIINPGESAILCFGAVRRMPWVVTGKDGSERIKPRWITQLSLAFDHRLVDGDLGSRTLADVAAVLEDPAKALVWG